MFTGLSKAGLDAVTTVPLLIVALPALLPAAEVWMAPAAANCEVLVNATPKVPAACAVGLIKN